VYIELALAVIPYYVLGLGHRHSLGLRSSVKTLAMGQSRTATSPSTSRRKRRSNSTSSNMSAKSTGSITPTPLSDTAMGFSLAQSVGPTRDFEGVGGWRLDNCSDADDDALWTGMNSRLELPADHVRRHHRSLTSEGGVYGVGSGGRSYSPENMMNTSRSRARTPPNAGIEGFSTPISLMSGKGGKRTASGSSGSSKGSSERILSMKQR
jgi:hypothetical protein